MRLRIDVEGTRVKYLAEDGRVIFEVRVAEGGSPGFEGGPGLEVRAVDPASYRSRGDGTLLLRPTASNSILIQQREISDFQAWMKGEEA